LSGGRECHLSFIGGNRKGWQGWNCCQTERVAEKRTAGLIGGGFSRCLRGFFLPGDERGQEGKPQCVAGTTVKTVHAADAAAVVNPAVFAVKAFGFAGRFTFAATGAGGIIKSGAEYRTVSKKTEDGPYRADGVAICPAMFPYGQTHCQETNYRCCQGSKAEWTGVHRVHDIFAEPGEDCFQSIVEGKDYGQGDVRRHPAKDAVRVQQGEHHRHSGQGTDNGNCRYAPAQFCSRGRMAKCSFFPGEPFCQPSQNILKNSERADDRTVHPAKEQGERDQKGENNGIGRQQSRYGLHGGQICETARKKLRNIEEEGEKRRNDKRCKEYSDLLQHGVPFVGKGDASQRAGAPTCGCA